MSDTNTLMLLCWSAAGCANGVREAKGIKCNVMNDVDDKTQSVVQKRKSWMSVVKWS